MQLHKIDHLYNKINNDIDFIYNIYLVSRIYALAYIFVYSMLR